MIAIVNYGVGNLFSLRCSLESLGLDVEVCDDKQDMHRADRIILPGVGAFEDAIRKLRESGLSEVIVEEAKRKKPLLGICLGMQLLFDVSYEFGTHKGLGLVPGEVCPLDADLQAAGYAYKVPHIGWNPLHILKPESPLLKYTKEGEYFYYVHSYYAKNCAESLVATSEYGISVTGVVQNENVYGTQFHPEKSGAVGLAMLRAFAEV